MKNKKYLSLVLAGAMTLSLAAPAMAAEQPEGPWYAAAQAYVEEKGLMTGTDKGFEPEGEITKATVLQTLYNKEGRPDAAQEEGAVWFADAAAWAEKNGLGTVEEDAVIDRGGVKTILEAYCDLKYTVADTLMTGNESGDMMLDKTLTRAEFAQILVRLDALEPYATAQAVFIDVEEKDGIPAHTIPAIVTLPTAEGTFPAVVMLHGTGSNKHEAGGGYDMAAPAMAKAGIATIRFDFMGIDESEASYTDYCFTSANIDAKAAADYVAGLEQVDGEKLAVLGWSQGGTNALLAAAAYPETFKAVVTWAGSVTSKTDSEDFQAQYKTAKKDGFYVQEYDWREPLQVGLRWYEENLKTDKLAEAAKIEAPILAIQGMKDTSVLPENAEKIVEVAKNEATHAYFIEDCDHTFNVFSGDYTAIYEAINAGIGFLQETLNGKIGAGQAAAISKYGNVGTDIPMVWLTAAGYEVGDVLTVEITGQEPITLPLGTGYSNVDQGSPLALADTSNNTLALAINRGDFATTYGLGAKGENGYAITEGVTLTIAMAEKGGYLAEMEIRELDSKRTNNREDYASDEIFANFRPIVMGNIAEGKLYRTSSPVNPELGRNTYADAFLKEAGVKTVVNLADDQATMEGYEGYADSYYATCNVIPLNMGVDMYSEDAKASLKSAFEFMIANEGPYAFHCTEGKDRAGYFAMLVEALMGASVRDMVGDYMQSFENYYFVLADSEQWSKIAESNIEKDLMKLAGVEDIFEIEKVDMAKAAETYMVEELGLTAEQVTALKDALSK